MGSIDFLRVSLACQLRWFQGETDPILRQMVIVVCCLADVDLSSCALFVSEPFLDLEDIEVFGFHFGFDEASNGTPVSHVIWSEVLPDLFPLFAEQVSEMANGEWFSIGLEVECVSRVLVRCFWSPVFYPVLEGFVDG